MRVKPKVVNHNIYCFTHSPLQEKSKKKVVDISKGIPLLQGCTIQIHLTQKKTPCTRGGGQNGQTSFMDIPSSDI